MADHSTIEWTDATWNPVTGCSVVSPGCTNCYAMKLAGTRLKHHPSRAGLTIDTKAGPVWNGKVRLNRGWLHQPIEWKKPRMIFVCAHGDLFHEDVPDEWIDHVFAVMAVTPWHTYQVLTKRADRMRRYFAETWQRPARAAIKIDDGLTVPEQKAGIDDRWHQIEHAIDNLPIPDDDRFWSSEGALVGRPAWPRQPLPNVWLGVSAEDQARADERVPDLLATPATIRFLSAEPLLGPIDLEEAWHGESAINSECWGDCAWCEKGLTPLHNCHLGRQTQLEFDRARSGLDWIIAGGESGRGARPMHPDWVRHLRDQCAAARVPFFFKQWGGWLPVLDRDRDDPDWRSDYTSLYENNRAILNLAGGMGFHGERVHVVERVGKKRAGRVLDGTEHNGMPQVRP